VGAGKLTGDHVCNAFPSQQQQIAHLRATSDAFADLCSDYSEVVAVLERLDSAQPDTKPDNRRAEFSTLEQQLRQEITRILESVAMGPGLSREGRD
jgi:hypothetical protein